MVPISLSEYEAGVLRELLDAKLVDLRREISHTDSPRFRETLYKVETTVQHVLEQLPPDAGFEE